MNQRVVITGIGVVSAIGTGKKQFAENLFAGKSGVSRVESFDTAQYPVHNGAEIKEFSAAKFVRKLPLNQVGRSSQFAIASARLALEDASLSLNGLHRETTGVSVGTTAGEVQVIEEYAAQLLNEPTAVDRKQLIAKYPSHLMAANIAAEFQLGGVNFTMPTACAAGNYAIAHAYETIRANRAAVMLAGAADSFSQIVFTGFAVIGAVDPEKCRPFDRNRKGLIPGEGAAMLVLETLQSAERRGARIYAEIAGYGLSCDAFSMTKPQPDGLGAARAMSLALQRSKIEPHEIDYISAHGTGTWANDRTETMAIKHVFQEHAYKVPVSSVKSMLGHAMASASAIEAAVCCVAIESRRIPPTINYEEPDPDCDLDYVPNQAREKEVKIAMSNAYAFGGTNASVIFRAVR